MYTILTLRVLLCGSEIWTARKKTYESEKKSQGGEQDALYKVLKEIRKSQKSQEYYKLKTKFRNTTLNGLILYQGGKRQNSKTNDFLQTRAFGNRKHSEDSNTGLK